MDDPKFKPKKPGQSKKDAAWALCTWLDQQGKLKATSDGVKITMDKAEMIFTGPFKVVEYIADQHTIMDANMEYFKGRPYLDKIIWRIRGKHSYQRDAENSRLLRHRLRKKGG